MTPERYEHIREIFDAVIDLPTLRRSAYLDQVCGVDADLRSHVKKLIDAAEETRAITAPMRPHSGTAETQNSSESDPRETLEGSLLRDRYRIERELGRGTFGIVYLARDEHLHNKLVVVKFLNGLIHRDDWFQKKFEDETRALARIDHPGVVGILDAGRTRAGAAFLVMQYIEGVTLRSLIGANRMNLRKASGIIRQIGQALAAAHSRGVLHRDLKPENIMVQTSSEGDLVRLIDFGIATVREEGVDRTGEPTRVAGSLAYMAPEQFGGQPTAASDIFAMGVIAWELLAGTRPFRGRAPIQALTEPGVLAELDGMRLLRPDVPERCTEAIRKALAIEPSDRFQTASAFGDELAQALITPFDPKVPPDPSVRHRVLDVAMARHIPIHKPAEVMALIRRTEGGGLAAVLQVEEDHSVTKEDIRSKPFQLEFPMGLAGGFKPLELGLRLECPDFEPTAVLKTLLVPPDGDSDACTFLITPKHLGELRVTVELIRGDVLVASRALKTQATPSDRQITDSSKVLLSIPLSVIVRAAEGASAPGAFTELIEAPVAPMSAPPAPPEAFTQPFQALNATTKLASAIPVHPQPEARRGEFTRMFQASDPAGSNPPLTSSSAPPAPSEPGEFTRIFESPGRSGPMPQSPSLRQPLAPLAGSSSGSREGEFTRVFGPRDTSVAPPSDCPTANPLSVDGAQTFEAPRSGPSPIRNQDGPGDFTRAFSVPAPVPTLGQVAPEAPPPGALTRLLRSPGSRSVSVMLAVVLLATVGISLKRGSNAPPQVATFNPPNSSAGPRSPALAVTPPPQSVVPSPAPRSVRPSSAPPSKQVQQATDCGPGYVRKKQETLVWNGDLKPGAALVLGMRSNVIDGGGGLESYGLPGCEVTIDPTTVTIGMAIEELPNARNQFSRIKLRNTTARIIHTVTFHWSIK